MYDFVPELREFLISNGVLEEFCDALVGDGRTDCLYPINPRNLVNALMCWAETDIEDTLADLHGMWGENTRGKYTEQIIDNDRLAKELSQTKKQKLMTILKDFRAD